MLNEYSQNKENSLCSRTINDINPSDINSLKQAKKIYDIGLGENYIPSEDLLSYASHPEKYISLGSYSSDGELLGVILANRLDEKEREKYNLTFQQNSVDIMLPAYTTGLIKSVAVKQEYRQKGIGAELIKEAIERLKDMSCELILAVAWASGKPGSSPKILEKLSFKNILGVEEYWKEDSLKEGYSCPNCGKPPCRCKALFYLHKANS